MQAIILAAGMGKRLKQLTENNTKCMVKVNGETLIERMLSQLDQYQLNRIILVVGYQGQKLKEYVHALPIKTPIQYVENPVYDKTNNIYSLFLASEELAEDDTVLLESDLIFANSALDRLLKDARPTLALVDKYESWMDGTVVKIDEDNNIRAFLTKKDFRFKDIKDYYKTVNIYKFSKHFSNQYYIPLLKAYTQVLGNNEYYEQILKIITIIDNSQIKAVPLEGESWYEIDDIQDLDIAESIFAAPPLKLNLFNQRYGGLWRYHDVLDYCYLVNPYFPPKQLLDEMKVNFDTLITHYPSGMRVNALLASKFFAVDTDHIAIANGAAELIKSVMDHLQGTVGVITPTFQEYINRYDADKTIAFTPKNEAFTYTERDIIAFFDDKRIDTLLLINPDNPSGNYIGRSGILSLLNWAKKKNIRVILDESFVDFSKEMDTSLIDEKIIAAYPQLLIVKSISKSYGVPGLRLGICVSADKELIRFIKRDVAIWNINSFAEFYLQIIENYKVDYSQALSRFREERARFKRALDQLQGLKVYDSNANYFLAHLESHCTATEFAERILSEYHIFIKDLTSKIKTDDHYIRIAIRNSKDNDRLLQAFQSVLNEE